ncbi:glycosyltransferase [Pantoea cypripedii]|uniref:TcdA/TcdB catalytic glycosyltransferase domain-containing protein n=1 Tax=Pantoea cypripedii TaxID=55209 RepID=UPI002FC89ECD
MMTQTGFVSNGSTPIYTSALTLSNAGSASRVSSNIESINNVVASGLPSNMTHFGGHPESGIGGAGNLSTGNEIAIDEQAQPEIITVPKIAHFVWEGKVTPEKHLFNILNFKRLNPDFEVKTWTTRPGLLIRTLDKMLNGENAEYRYLAFNFSDISDGKRFLHTSDPRPLFAGLGPGVYAGWARETSGCFNNQAAASDITRLAALYQFGGTYFDVDVYMTGKFECPIYNPERSNTSGILTYGNMIITAIKHSPSLLATLQTINENYTCLPRSTGDDFYASNDLFSSDRNRRFKGADVWDVKRTMLSGRIQGTMRMTGIDVFKGGWWPEAVQIGCGNMVFGHHADHDMHPTKSSLVKQHKILTKEMNKQGVDQKQKALDIYMSQSSDWRAQSNDCMVYTDEELTRDENMQKINDPLSRHWRKDVDTYAQSYKNISKLKSRRSSS